MEQKDSLTDEGYLIYATVIAVLFFAGLTGQILSLLVLSKKDHRQREMTPFLANISIANTMLIVINFPVVFVSSLAGHWVLNRVGCVVLGFNAGLTSVVMITTLASVTVNIYRKISTHNINNRLTNVLTRNSNWIKIVVVIWAYSLLVMLPNLFGLGSIELEAGNTHCAPEWRSHHLKNVIYLLFLTIAAFVVPISATCVGLIKLNRFLAKSQRENSTLTSQQRRHYEQYKSAANMMGVATFVFFLAWTPYCVCSLIILFSNSDVFTGTVSITPGLFAKSSVIYNPILYTILNRRFRYSMLMLLPGSLRKKSLRGQIHPGSSRQVPGAWYDQRQGTSKKLVPRSPITGRSKSSSHIVTLEPGFSSQLKSGGVSPRSKPSIRFLLRPSFLGLKMLRPQLSDDGPVGSASDAGPYISEEPEESSQKVSRIKAQASF